MVFLMVGTSTEEYWLMTEIVDYDLWLWEMGETGASHHLYMW